MVLLLGAPALAQTGGELILKAWPKEQAVDASADAYLLNGGHVQETGSSLRLSIFESDGRFRLMPGEIASPRIGYSFTAFDMTGAKATGPGRVHLPDQLYDTSVAFATPIGKYGDWIVAISGGIGYTGSSPFGDADAWYGKADFAVIRQLDEGSGIAFVLDYNGNRPYLPDVPLPGFAYIKRIDPTLLLTLGVPVTSVEWKPTDSLRVELGYVLVDEIRARIGYDVAPHWEVFGSAGLRQDAFHLNEITAGNARLLFEQRRAEIGVTWRPTESFDLTIAGGYAWGGEFSTGFDLRNSQTLAKLSDEPYLRAGLQIRF
jgi:hypothetical protein